MDIELARRIDANPAYRRLRDTRLRFGWALALLMMLVYYGFILLVAFDKEFLARPLGSGVTTIGIPIGLGVIVFTVLITAVYVHRANTEFDALSEQVRKDAQR